MASAVLGPAADQGQGRAVVVAAVRDADLALQVRERRLRGRTPEEFRAKGAAGLAPSRVIGGDTWNAVQRPLVVSLGDGNDDGRADLWVTTKYDPKTDTGADLWFRPGTTGAFGTPVLVGEGGWGYIESLA